MPIYGFYSAYAKELSKIEPISSGQVECITKKVIPENDRRKITITQSRYVAVPFVSGLRKATIVLPAIAYTDEELRFIIEHEYIHFRNKDAYIRLLVAVFCAVFWWNPIVHLLKFDLDNTLEMKCDRRVIQGRNKADILSYGQVLLKFASTDISKKASFITSEFSSDKAIKQRFQLIYQSKRGERYQRIIGVGAGCFLISTLLLSYAFSFQSQYAPKNNTQGADGISISQIANTDGTFTVTFQDGTQFYVTEETRQRMTQQKVVHQ